MSCDITLKKNGFKLTPQRRLILDIIHDSGMGITGTEILGRVNAKMPGVNKSTVYRTLELLEKLECVFKNEADGEFVYHHPEDGEHYHLVCRVCGASIDFDESLLQPLEKTIEKTYGFQIDYRHVTIGGLCPDCKNKH
jgi:Fur family transcriptional regulator, ferric uptake regulator